MEDNIKWTERDKWTGWTITLKTGAVFEKDSFSEVCDSYVNFFTEEDGKNNIESICEADEDGKIMFEGDTDFVSNLQFQLEDRIRVNLRTIASERGSLKGE
jgi:hypothetical protein